MTLLWIDGRPIDANHPLFAPGATEGPAPYEVPEDQRLVQTLPPSDPASVLASGSDVGSTIAVLVFLTQKEQRTNARNSRDAAYAAQDAAEAAELSAMDAEASAKRDAAFIKGAYQIGSGLCSFAAVASPKNEKAWEAESKLVDAESTFACALANHEADDAARDVRAAGQAVGQIKRVAEGYADDVRDAEKSMAKAVDFLKEWRAARDAAISAAIHRA